MANETCTLCSEKMVYACSHEFGNDTPPCAMLLDKTFNSLQQLQAKIAALVNRLESYSRSQEVDNDFWDIVEEMRQLSAVHSN